jgi:hypothetical protein
MFRGWKGGNVFSTPCYVGTHISTVQSPCTSTATAFCRVEFDEVFIHTYMTSETALRPRSSVPLFTYSLFNDSESH